MISSMATRNPTGAVIDPHRSTEFQLHISQVSMFNNTRDKVFDYAEHRLLMLRASSVGSMRFELTGIIEDYRRGLIAVAWQCGRPVYVHVMQDK